MPLPVMLLVLLGAALHATWNALVKAGSDRLLDTAGVMAGAALLTLLWLPFLPLPSRASWPHLAVSVLIHQVYFALIALAYRKGDMSLVYPLMRGTAPALTALLSGVVLAESLSPGGWLGVLCVSGGVLLLAFDTRRSQELHTAPIVFALLNAGVIACYTLVDGTGVRLSGQAFSYTSWGFLLSGMLFTPMALLARRRAAIPHFRKAGGRGLVGGACSIAAYGLALWAMTRAPIAAVAALRETSIIFGVLLAAVTLKERVSSAAVLIVIAGVVVIKLL
jgi:drug/metabolite transporter (DMT)-like permease